MTRLAVFFFDDPSTTEIYTLSLHDALPIWSNSASRHMPYTSEVEGNRMRLPYFTQLRTIGRFASKSSSKTRSGSRSEEHTSELQSRLHLVCRLLLEKKKETELLCPTDQTIF